MPKMHGQLAIDYSMHFVILIVGPITTKMEGIYIGSSLQLEIELALKSLVF